MKSALIGYTGFVGSNIYNQAPFDEIFNSKNIDDVKGKEFDLVVCAGVPAVKWWANQNPEQDLAVITSLSAVYKTIKAKRFVLISTVDVYPVPTNVTETTPIDIDVVGPYGKHRLMLEKSLEGCFKHFHVIRLPGLFGQGLKKNILFDMLCGNILEKINLQSSFQWYPLSRIWQDIQTVVSKGLPVVNMAVEPVSTKVIKDTFFPLLTVGADPFPAVHYDMKTDFPAEFGMQSGAYMMNAEQVLTEMANWLKNPEVKCG
ncbi:NAD-dependent epimerase/dehydratase family protein [Zobellella sp. An-6]|uniref:NAD-dependent epimerase/dehydratase family protein n=1 Tax=Zobellella sp. An-6 TaxID=3400218 RepID=UPI00404118FA